MTTFINSARHAIDAGDGRMIAPGEAFELDVDEVPAEMPGVVEAALQAAPTKPSRSTKKEESA